MPRTEGRNAHPAQQRHKLFFTGSLIHLFLWDDPEGPAYVSTFVAGTKEVGELLI